MFYVKSSIGEEVPITCGGVFTRCPKCGVEHQVDLVDLIVTNAEEDVRDILDSTMYCENCSRPHVAMWENADKLQAVADRFGTDLGEVQEIVRSGLDHGFSFDTALVGARLALSMKTGKHELFSLDDVAAALGCTREEAAAEVKELGVEPMKMTTLPGFEWLLGK